MRRIRRSDPDLLSGEVWSNTLTPFRETDKSMKIMTALILAIMLTGCAGVSHVGARPNFSEISIGMSQQEVIEKLGKPEDLAAQGGVVYLNYTHAPWYDHDGADGNATKYFVRLVDDKVESFGKLGDFDSTKPPEQTINVNVNKDD